LSPPVTPPIVTVTVAVPLPLDPLTYSIPRGLRVARGARVVVPIGRRTTTGYVLAVEHGPAPIDRPLKDVLEVLDDEPFLPEAVLRLASWIADYYVCSVGEAIAAAMPRFALSRDRRGFKSVRVVEVTAAGLDPAVDAGLTPKQRAALAVLRDRGGATPLTDLDDAEASPAIVARLARHGLVALRRATVERDPLAEVGRDAVVAAREAAKAAVDLTAEQASALDRLCERAAERRFRVAVLHGVTGSGKTEVYRRLALRVRDDGRQVLILVPEIALTPATAATFRHTFGDRVAIQHSGLSDGERHDQWHRIRRGEVDVVVGTRSAVFAPLSDVGLIIVDEEHDTSYKQEEAPRYHGRDVAIVRARDASALVVLGSATPALETYQNTRSGRYELVELTRRVMERPLAEVRIVDMRAELAAEGPDVVLSRPLREALARRLSAGEQAIVLLNRRGYATAVFCRKCGGTLECPNCSVSLTVHRAAKQARCHYCDHAQQVPASCLACGAPFVDYVGFGTERVEAELRAAFDGVRVARVDRDTVRRRVEITRVLARFAAGEIDVLVGTQMLAKGHDFPDVTLVGVVSADVGLGLADFRAAERTFQLLTQVAGRAGRGERRGEAIIQTLFPEHYSIKHARAQDYAAFFTEEYRFRQAMRYPPAVALVNIGVRGKTLSEARQAALALVRDLATTGPRPYQVLGPAPAPIARLRGDYRVQVFLKGTDRRRTLQALRRAVAQHPELQRRLTIDVDPLTVL
jgi:primosomal protein N' (replication factor Y)